MVEGPWAYAFQIATVLSDSKAHQVREADERAAALEVETGSLIWVDGVQYRVEFDRHDHVKLVPVDNDNQPCMMPGVGLHNAAPPSRRRA
jgi:hypothetical protein